MKFKGIVFCLIILFLSSCSKPKAVFVHDQYYQYIFDSSLNWQNELKKAASVNGFDLDFHTVTVSSSVPSLTDILKEIDSRYIITSPLFFKPPILFFVDHQLVPTRLIFKEKPEDLGRFVVLFMTCNISFEKVGSRVIKMFSQKN